MNLIPPCLPLPLSPDAYSSPDAIVVKHVSELNNYSGIIKSKIATNKFPP